MTDRKILAQLEVEMAHHRVEVLERLAEAGRHVTHNADTGSVWGWGERVDEYLDALEAVEALGEFPPHNWWDTPPSAPSGGRS